MPGDKRTPRTLSRTVGIASVIAALLAVAGDELAQYSPQGYASPSAVEHALPIWRLLSGEFLGILGIPLCLLGYWCVCQAVRPRGRKGVEAMFWLIAFGLVMGVVSHAIVSSAYIVMQTGSASEGNSIATLQTAAFVPGGLFLISYFIVSVWYAFLTITGRIRHPRWMVCFTPFLLSLVIALLNAAHILPLVGNVLWPAWLSIPHLLFFILSTLFLWHAEPLPEQYGTCRMW